MKKAAIVIFAMCIVYCLSYFWHKGWLIYDHIVTDTNERIFVLTGDLRQRVGLYISDPPSSHSNTDLIGKERFLYNFYYPLIKIDRIFGNYHLFDNWGMHISPTPTISCGRPKGGALSNFRIELVAPPVLAA